MNYQEIKSNIIVALNNIGIYVDEGEDDIDLTDYITDSMTYIYFIIEIEDSFNVMLPEGMMLFDKLKSLNAFAYSIQEVLQK